MIVTVVLLPILPLSPLLCSTTALEETGGSERGARGELEDKEEGVWVGVEELEGGV